MMKFIYNYFIKFQFNDQNPKYIGQMMDFLFNSKIYVLLL